MCVVGSTWVQIDMTKLDGLPVSAPPETFQTTTRIVHALALSLGLDTSALQIMYVPFITAPHFVVGLGYIVACISQRFGFA